MKTGLIWTLMVGKATFCPRTGGSPAGISVPSVEAIASHWLLPHCVPLIAFGSHDSFSGILFCSQLLDERQSTNCHTWKNISKNYSCCSLRQHYLKPSSNSSSDSSKYCKQTNYNLLAYFFFSPRNDGSLCFPRTTQHLLSMRVSPTPLEKEHSFSFCGSLGR